MLKPPMQKRARGAPLSNAERAGLTELMEELGENELMLRLGIGRHTLARALGGLGMYPPTLFLIRHRLTELRDPVREDERTNKKSTPNP